MPLTLKSNLMSPRVDGRKGVWRRMRSGQEEMIKDVTWMDEREARMQTKLRRG